MSQCSPGRKNKKITLGMERAEERQIIYKEIQAL
jgi:hypothetical protein